MFSVGRSSLHVVGVIVALALSGCGVEQSATFEPSGTVVAAPGDSSPRAGDATTDPPQSEPAIVNVWSGESVDITSLPLGDGRVSTTNPAAGSVYSCTGGDGARAGGPMESQPWIHGKTWDMTAKTVVEGNVSWPAAAFKVTTDDHKRTITTNSLPVDAVTGEFPISPSDPAYEYDRNPNSIGKRSLTLVLPLNPQKASKPQCVPMGPIAVMLNGVLLFNALDAAGRDGVAHEVQDVCQGHPARRELYHYHDVPACLRDAASGASTVVGWAYDGYPIVVERDADGELPTNADLDQCHGRTSQILLSGNMVTSYHYSATLEYPYTIGCFAASNAVARTGG